MILDSPITSSPGFAARREGERRIGDGKEEHPVSDPMSVQEPPPHLHRNFRVSLPGLEKFHPEILDQPVPLPDLADASHRHSPHPFR
jgi:hypothetical protein